MYLLRMLEFLAVGILLFGFITELAIPFFKGTLYFPSFRGKRSKIQDELASAREEVEISEIKSEITKTKAETKGQQEGPEKNRRSKK